MLLWPFIASHPPRSAVFPFPVSWATPIRPNAFSMILAFKHFSAMATLFVGHIPRHPPSVRLAARHPVARRRHPKQTRHAAVTIPTRILRVLPQRVGPSNVREARLSHSRHGTGDSHTHYLYHSTTVPGVPARASPPRIYGYYAFAGGRREPRITCGGREEGANKDAAQGSRSRRR